MAECRPSKSEVAGSSPVSHSSPFMSVTSLLWQIYRQVSAPLASLPNNGGLFGREKLSGSPHTVSERRAKWNNCCHVDLGALPCVPTTVGASWQHYAGIAQLVERWFCTPVVAGSIPATSSICWDGLMVERSSRTALASVRFRVPAPSGGGRDRRRNSFLAVLLAYAAKH